MSLESPSIREQSFSSAASYSQWPIDPKLEIRILELLPPVSPDPMIIHGNLVTAKLSDKPAYEALSYAWGHLVYCEKIYLPTSYLEITSNLATALRQLRHQDRPRKLWVDALCINQSDEAEKGHQVMLMAQIYSGTKSCLAWLGEANTETHAAVRTIRDLASKAWRFGIFDLKTALDTYPGSNGEGVKKAREEVKAQLDFKPINAFFKQAWFSRLWVVQEACLPPEVILCNGPYTLNFDDISILRLLRLAPESHFTIVKERGLSKSEQCQAAFNNLRETIFRHRGKACANPADKIYGLLGLKQLNNTVDIVVDYGSRVEEVYRDFSLKYLQKDDISVLHYAGKGFTGPNDYQTSNLVTWAIDWMSLQRDPMVRLVQTEFNAATKLPPRLSVENSTLPFIGVVGAQIGIVEEEVSTLTHESESLNWTWFKFPQRMLSVAQQFTKSKHRYPTGDSMANAFARCMVLDCRTSLTNYSIKEPQTLQALWGQFECAINNGDAIGMETSGAGAFILAAAFSSITRNIVVTDTGYFGLGPKHTKRGDVIAIFDGDTTPFVLRQIKLGEDSLDSKDEGNFEGEFSPDEQYELIGECYVHGFMDNEVAAPEWRAKEQTFWIK